MAWQRPRILFRTTLLLAALASVPVEAGNTTCVSKQLDWYTSVVGESPCITYQRLRQICNNDYEVPSFASTVPGDRCDDQVSECCRNLIAFQLSMLCMVCQQDHLDTGGGGIDAPDGSFDVYTSGHPPGTKTNHTLPDDLQRAVCNSNIRLDDYLYGGWDSGAWFYVYTKEYAEFQHAAHNNNTFTVCQNQTSVSSALISESTANAAVGSATAIAMPIPSVAIASTSRGHGALIGGVVGGVVGLTALVILAAVWMRMRRRAGTGSKGSQWSKNPQFGYMFSSMQASTTAPKSSVARSMFGLGGPLASKFTYRDPDFTISGSRPTSPRTATEGWSNAATRAPSRSSPTPMAPPPLPSEDVRLDSRPFPAVHSTRTDGAAIQAGEFSTHHIQAPSGSGGSVSLSTFDFASAPGHDDGHTMRSFPLSAVTTTEFGASRNPPTRTPGRWR